MEVLSSRIIIRPRSMPRSRQFYETVLGLRIYREWSVGVVYFLGGGFLELSTGGRDAPVADAPGGPPAAALWLQVPDLAAAEQVLVAAGADITQPASRMPWGLDELWLRDPDGHELHLVEVPPGHPLRSR
jgi:predicted enzyme related to lactoylglutathione lyase